MRELVAEPARRLRALAPALPYRPQAHRGDLRARRDRRTGRAGSPSTPAHRPEELDVRRQAQARENAAGGWKVDWTPAAINPSLKQGRSLRLVTEKAAHGRRSWRPTAAASTPRTRPARCCSSSRGSSRPIRTGSPTGSPARMDLFQGEQFLQTMVKPDEQGAAAHHDRPQGAPGGRRRARRVDKPASLVASGRRPARSCRWSTSRAGSTGRCSASTLPARRSRS